MITTTPQITMRAVALPPLAGNTRDVRSTFLSDSPSYWGNLLLIRHGESTCNEVNRFAGSADVPLTDLGRAQARQAAKTWIGAPPDYIFVSPLSRALETAEILFPSGKGSMRHRIEARIAERHFGDFTLRNKAELQSEFGISGYDEALYDPTEKITGAESFESFHGRVAEFLFETLVPLLKSGRRVLVVAHKYVVELFFRLILEMPFKNGFDLRLPNSKVLSAGDAKKYCKRESRTLNRMREWTVLHHDRLLAASVVTGMLAACFGISISMHWSVGITLLAVATLISLMRVDLNRLSQSGSLSWARVLLRFAVFPIVVGWIGFLSELSLTWICSALVLCAPAATTSVILSRCAGGMVLPAVGAIFRSSFFGCVAMILLHQLLLGSGNWTLLPLLVGVALFTIFLPCVLAGSLRKHAPIATANWGERQAYLSVLFLCGFVFLSSTQLDPSTFFPCGIIAVTASMLVRIAAWILSRRTSLNAADDYLSMAYPNLFIVILLGQLLGFVELTQMATWFLLPMFLLSPFDVRICRNYELGRNNELLQNYLGIRRSENHYRLVLD